MDEQNTTQTNNKNGKETSELDACKKQAEEYLNNWKRERADFINYKKDEAKRMEEFVKFANEGLILELLDIIEESIFARNQMPKEIAEKYSEWLNGVDEIRKKGLEFLKRQGVEQIKTTGEKFDPLFHESVAEVDSEGKESGMIIEEVKPGFTLHGRVIKPAKVRIVK